MLPLEICLLLWILLSLLANRLYLLLRLPVSSSLEGRFTLHVVCSFSFIVCVDIAIVQPLEGPLQSGA